MAALEGGPGVYALICEPSNAYYVGSSVALARRVSQHFSYLEAGRHPNSRLQRSFTKHGRAAFRAVALEAVPEKGALVTREQAWIDHFAVLGRDHTLNLSPTAQNTLGYRFSPEAVEKIRRSLTGRKLSAAHREKCRARMLGSKHTKETKAKIAAAHRGRKRGPLSAEHRAIIGERQRGGTKSAETRAKIGASRKGKPRPEWVKQKMRDTLRRKREAKEEEANAPVS